MFDLLFLKNVIKVSMLTSTCSRYLYGHVYCILVYMQMDVSCTSGCEWAYVMDAFVCKWPPVKEL